MKRLTVVLLCLLLWGCGRQPPTVPAEIAPETTPDSPATVLYDPGHPLENAYPGLIRAYPITAKNPHGLRAVGKGILLLSGQDCTTMTVFTGDDLQETASLNLCFPLQQDDPSLQIHQSTISYFDPLQQETVVLNHRLQEIRRIAAPEGLSGKPVLAANGNILYYCTGWAVMEWDLSSGIRRMVKEMTYESQELTATHQDDRILECTIQDKGISAKLFLSADLGLEIASLPENAMVSARDNRYFASVTSGYQTMLISGETGKTPELLLPDQTWQNQFYLPEDHAAITTVSVQNGTQLNYYELNTGILRSSVLLEAVLTPKQIVNSSDHFIYILAYDLSAECDILCRWDVLRQPPDPGNTLSYITDYYSPETPDIGALEACREAAKKIGDKYGITLLLWEDAIAVQPWDYRFEPEYLAPVLQKELQLLDQRLAMYPDTLLQQAKAHFTGLTICLVRQITGSGDDRSLPSATGIQYFKEKEAYVVITTGRHSEQALYHELYHVMETHILTESTALDQWESLNPAGFVYGTDSPDDDIYLQGQTQAFVDRYSMRIPKEDRARILENAMLQGNRDLFRSEYLQRKLRTLCTGLREAYNLQSFPEELPWEQYLITPLIPGT